MMKPINSRAKGARGERQWRDELRANGYQARRGQQYCGSPDSPDVVCTDLDWIHFEIKAVQRLNLEDAMEQARRDAHSKWPILAHRRNFRSWLVTMDAQTFFALLRGDLPQQESRLSRSSRLPPLQEPADVPDSAAATISKVPLGPEK